MSPMPTNRQEASESKYSQECHISGSTVPVGYGGRAGQGSEDRM